MEETLTCILIRVLSEIVREERLCGIDAFQTAKTNVKFSTLLFHPATAAHTHDRYTYTCADVGNEFVSGSRKRKQGGG